MSNRLPYIQLSLISKILGTLIAITGTLMMLPTIYALFDEARGFFPLFSASVLSISIGLFMRFGLGRRSALSHSMPRREGYITVTFSWVAISLFGALPFIFSHSVASYTDAFFETISGFTTTGASILPDIEALPKALLLWRAMTHWIGGIGIIVFCLAILPMLGIGGNMLFAAEASGPTKDKIHPRIAETAKRLCAIYIGLTLLEVFLLLFGEMEAFDAVCHSMATMATGGFSTKNDSIMSYGAYTQYIIALFMFLAGINFGMYYFALMGKLDRLRQNSELKAYTLFTLASTAFITTILLLTNHQMGGEEAFRTSAFLSTSIITTTGFVSADYGLWFPSTHLFIIVLMFSGACAGSTTGGIKMIRHVLLLKNLHQEFKRLLHTRAILPVKCNGKQISNETINNVLAFFYVYFAIFAIGALFMSTLGYAPDTSISMSATALANVGPAIGEICALCNYSSLPDIGKWMMCLLMVIGRLELFTVLILFTPSFWRK